MITVLYHRFKDGIFRFAGKITNPTTGRKIKVYFSSSEAKKEAKKQDAREVTRVRRRKKNLKKWGLK